MTTNIEIVTDDLVARRVVVGTLDTNCWILYSPTGRDAIIVDPGDEPQRIIDACHGLTPTSVVLTHQHWDHVLALPDIADHYGIHVHAHPDDHQVWPTKPDTANVTATSTPEPQPPTSSTAVATSAPHQIGRSGTAPLTPSGMATYFTLLDDPYMLMVANWVDAPMTASFIVRNPEKLTAFHREWMTSR